MDVRPPDVAFALPGVPDDSAVVLRGSTRFERLPAGLVGSTPLILASPGQWTFDTLYVYLDDTGDTATFGVPPCNEQTATLDLSLQVDDATGNPVDESQAYPTAELTLPASEWPCDEQTPWPDVTVTMCFTYGKA